eukprot:PhM_4_TR11944/c0_g1_i1/m.35033
MMFSARQQQPQQSIERLQLSLSLPYPAVVRAVVQPTPTAQQHPQQPSNPAFVSQRFSPEVLRAVLDNNMLAALHPNPHTLCILLPATFLALNTTITTTNASKEQENNENNNNKRQRLQSALSTVRDAVLSKLLGPETVKQLHLSISSTTSDVVRAVVCSTIKHQLTVSRHVLSPPYPWTYIDQAFTPNTSTTGDSGNIFARGDLYNHSSRHTGTTSLVDCVIVEGVAVAASAEQLHELTISYSHAMYLATPYPRLEHHLKKGSAYLSAYDRGEMVFVGDEEWVPHCAQGVLEPLSERVLELLPCVVLPTLRPAYVTGYTSTLPPRGLPEEIEPILGAVRTSHIYAHWKAHRGLVLDDKDDDETWALLRYVNDDPYDNDDGAFGAQRAPPPPEDGFIVPTRCLLRSWTRTRRPGVGDATGTKESFVSAVCNMQTCGRICVVASRSPSAVEYEFQSVPLFKT